MHNYNLLESLLFLHTRINRKKLSDSILNKTILITGASSGIGKRLALYLAGFDCHLILVARRKERLIELKSDIEKKVATASVYDADLRNEEEVLDFTHFLHSLPNGLDIFVSNAGLSIRRSIFDSLDRFHDFKRTMAINYFAPVQLLLSTIPLLEQNKGQIINISTINNSLIPFPKWAAYQASKSAFDTWFRSVSTEVNAAGITTTSIYLPLVKTPMIKPTKAYKNMPAMSPEHVAKIIGKSIFSKRRKYQPWWLIFAQLASVIFRGVWERFGSKVG
ncbi:SDR family NAD(P)-dependent oxidoreductase [Filobacillus milosensis]|uniref:SDR family NAD(P)-dependent oxidoreductase n=1 Tax=Filobacillus milosensis TaxID=94137 RepID=A0A4Y8IQF0_9BACI|nr:SDR family NAD(P)-dependent oxidoreductase [Filobacillus milosensis]TFB22923.1 SDR family NAD(P)-dependent oxidoreductase [Filobacillus milosensis]